MASVGNPPRARWRGLATDPHPDVENRESMRVQPHGVEVELQDFRTAIGQGRYLVQQASQRRLVAGRLAPMTGEKRATGHLAEKVVDVGVGEREQPRRRWSEQLHHRSARAAHHDGPEDVVVHEPNQQLDARGRHPLNQEASQLVSQPPTQVATGGTHRVAVAETEVHTANLRLVQQLRPNRLDRHRKAKRHRALDRFAFGRNQLPTEAC